MKLRRTYAAFTLIELLVVIAIIGILAALVGPTLTGFRKGDAMLAGTRTLLAGVARARQLAISQHTTVYMVFAPQNFWGNGPYPSATAYGNLSTSPTELAKATNILEKQLTGFTFVSLRTIADQPGNNTPRYLSAWQSLPDKTFVADWKFNQTVNQAKIINDAFTGLPLYTVYGFNATNTLPFPSEDAYYFLLNKSLPLKFSYLPYIAFDYQGRLVTADGEPLGRDEFIPLAHGSVATALDPVTRKPIQGVPSIQEDPPGNSTNSSYNLIHIDWLTGRARAERQQSK